MGYDSVVVTGANRGIGLQLIKDLVNQTTRLIATARDVEKATELKQLASKHPNLHILKIEAVDYASYPSFVSQVEKIVGGKGLQVLICNAGVASENGLDWFSQELLMKTFNVNANSPIFLSRHLMPLLEKSVGAGQRTICVHITGLIASNELNYSFFTELIAYRMSKAALNQGVRCLANHYKDNKVEFVLLHPGHVATDMGNMGSIVAPVTTEESVKGMLKCLNDVNLCKDGRLVTYEGTFGPW